MEDDRDIFQICVDSAAAEGLEFLLIGGHAVNAHGYQRTTIDFDFLIPSRDLRKWSALLDRADYRLITEHIKAFAQFEPKSGEGFRVDLMLVDDGTFAKLRSVGETRTYGNRPVLVAGIFHLIALKLHALRSEDRAAFGKDYLDILNLIRSNGIDIDSPQFEEPQDSPAGSAGTSDSLFDLNLPKVGPDEGPLPHPEPSYELMKAHARFLLSCPDTQRNNPNPEPFVLD